MRRENKFVFPETDLGSVRSSILISRFLFSEIFTERRVNNIYLDSMTFANLKDNLNGVQNRIKHRIRWYGDGLDIKKPILEYKIKQGELGYKEYFSLPKFKFDETFDYDEYLEVIYQHSKGRSPEDAVMYSEIQGEIPTLCNSYLRRYYLSGDGKYRLTIDKDITYKSIGRRFDGSFSFSEDKIVVELKYDDEHVKGVSRIMQDLGLRVSRNSKYVIGMQGIYFNNFIYN
jgi:hypothetical protein